MTPDLSDDYEEEGAGRKAKIIKGMDKEKRKKEDSGVSTFRCTAIPAFDEGWVKD